MKTVRKLKLLLATVLMVGWSGTALAAISGTVTINGTTYTMTNTSTLIDADIALLDLKAQGNAGTATVTANIDGTSYSGYTDVYNAMYDYLVANCTHKFPATGTPNAPHSTGAQYIWPEDSESDAIWYIPNGKEATFQKDDAGWVGSRLVVVGGGTIKRVMDRRRFFLGGNDNLVLCLQGQLTIDGGGAPDAKFAILSVASGKVYIAGSVKIKDSHGQYASVSGGGGAITLRDGTIYMMDNAQILNCNSKTTETDPEPETDPNPNYISHGGAVAMLGGTFKMMGNAKISGCTAGYRLESDNGFVQYPSLGGAVYIDGGTFTMNDNAKIQNCSAIVGGAVYVVSGSFVMNGGLIGGTDMTLNLQDGTTLTYPNVPATDYNYITEITPSPSANIARNGGAIYAQGGYLKFNGGVIAGNSTEGIGAVANGILYFPQEDPRYVPTYYGSCILTQGTANIECHDGMMFYGNRSYGSVIFIGAGHQLETLPHNVFYGGQVYCNLELRHYGAGIAVTTGAVADLRNNTEVCYNSTYRNGGGLLSLQGAEINLYDDDVLVSHNTAIGDEGVTNTGNGGAFRVVGKLNIYKGTISYNYANGYNTYPDDPNDDSGMGGAISATTDQRGGHQETGGVAGLRIAEVNLYGGTIEHNKCSRYGGGIYLSSYMTDTATFTLQGTTIRENESAFDGGACYLSARQGVLIAKLRNGMITNNTANRDGGGLFFNVLDEATKGIVTIGAETEPNNIVITNNEAVEKGGGVFVTNSTEQPANLTMLSGYVKENEAQGYGGGFYVAGGSNVNIMGGSIDNNETKTNGGGFYVDGGTVSVEGGAIKNNLAKLDGGGFYVNTINATDTTYIKGGAMVSNNNAVNGGGAYIKKGHLRIDNNATTINANKASTAGGGIYMVSGTVLFNDATMQADTAQYGGGFYLANGDAIIDGATICDNVSTVGHGGAFDIANGSLTVGHSSITRNKAPNGNGGGAYVGNGTVVFNEGTSVTYNTAINGGGLYVGGGSITYNNGEINHNTATGNGGGIYANADVAFNGGMVSENTARNGGGLYASVGTVDFSSGTFSQNYASGNGGGIYVKQGAIVQLSGNAVITKNHVPFAVDEEVGHGGGVYLAGQMKVGRNPGDPQGTHSLQVQDNYENVATMLNNVFLPTNENVIELLSDLRGSTGTKIGFSVNNGFRKVVYHNNDGSTTTSSWLHDLLGGTQGLTGVIFDDSQKYMAIHVLSSNETFDHNYIYLWGCWISAVDKDPNTHTDEYPLPSGTAHHYTIADDGTWHIYTKEGLAWFSSYVNGLNEFQTGYDEDVNAAAKAVMEADVDMSEFLWVPLGSAKSFTSASTSPTGSIFEDGHLFKGSFDGRGHVINGLDCRYINSIHNYGLFGKLVGEANVCNTFVDNYLYSSNEETDESDSYFMGGIAGFASGNSIISNCEARGRQSSPHSTISILGGIVGNLQDNASVHSSIGLPELAGVATTMGGIAGQTAAGNSIKNSYSNPKIGTVSGNVGGLVGTNAGTVENCYVRLQHATAPTNFYWFAAVNNGTVSCCYARNDAASDHYTTVTAATGSGTYGLTQLPYLYKHRDTQVAATNRYVPTGTDADKQLMIVLNRWVDTINSKQSAINYTKWGRPWQESDAQKPLNDDYPILKMPMAEAVAAESTDPYLYYGTVDNLLTKYDAAGDAIWMYRNPSDTVRGDNSTSAAKLYIAEDVVLLNDNALKAYVGITLDNSAGADGAYPTYFQGVTDVTDWHMIATPLSDAPIGINYTDGDAYDFDYGHPSGMPYYRFFPKDDAKHGYFPSHRFGKSYPGSDATIEAGNYYTEWDFYSYSEPDYHWINFKRNSASHHHMEAENHSSITYDNETRLVPGKGYFAATREETFLQCQGHLNADEVTYDLTQTSGVPRHGYNLIGNPYQAYLDFDAFADANSGDNKIWAAASNASYTILDEDELERSINVETIMGQKPVFYRTYSYGCSDNPDVSAGGFIHPHQGFFVRLEGDKASAQAQFAPDQRNATDTVGSKFRGAEHIDYPLVNLFAIEGNGAADVVTVELGRPDEGGAALMQGLRVGNGKIWCHYNDKDYAIAYTQPGITEVGIRFETVEDTEYTMRWSTRNGNFSYLHLIDNKTGADVDCLTTDEYRFSASTSDYKSRFRLVFGYTGIEEPEAEANENFAFMMNDALVVTGEGVLQVFDMTGRMVANQELHGVQTTVSLPAAANGVYVLRLTNGRQSQVQKMVISK